MSEIELPIVDVYLMEDRAKVHRCGKVELEAGLQHVVISRVAPAASDKTLQVHIDSDDVTVVSAKISRTQQDLETLSENDRAVLLQELKNRKVDYGFLERDTETLLDQLETLVSLEQQSLDETVSDISLNKTMDEDWNKHFESLDQTKAKALDSYIDSKFNLVDEHEKLESFKREISSKEGFTSYLMLFKIEITVDVAVAGAYDLDIEYITPNACWRPCHVATLSADLKRISMESQACVWQNTGESWDDVDLVFSTRRASLGVEPPELTQDLLHVQKKPEQVVVEMREQVVQDVGLGSAQKDPEMPGIDDGGESLNLKAIGKHTVPNDGRAYYAPLFNFETESTCELICMPELSDQVVLKSEASNTTSSPLLAGPVELQRHSGRVGKTSINFIAAGEGFTLGWGPDADVRVQRHASAHSPKAGLMSSWESTEHSVGIKFSNIGGNSKTIHVQERIPVSDIELVQIEQDLEKTSESMKANEHGFINWVIDLRPNKGQELKHKYTLKKKKSVQEA